MFDLQLIAGIWEWLVPAVFITIYLLNHLLSSKAGPAQKREAQRRHAAERPLRPAQPEPAGKSQLNTEIEQFLKRANERRLEKARQAEPPRAASQPARPPEPHRQPPLRELAPAEQPTDVVPLERRDFDSVAASVEEHLGKRNFEEREEHLADDIVLSDREREQHFKKVFDHRLGTLGGDSAAPKTARDAQSAAPAADTSQTAKALAGLLANSESIKQAIVLMEILERPVDRW